MVMVIQTTILTLTLKFSLGKERRRTEESPRSTAVVRSCDRSEGFLTGRVPDLELDVRVVEGDLAAAELYANGEIVHGLEAFVGEL